MLLMPRLTWTGGTSQEARRPLSGFKAMLSKIFLSRKPSPPTWVVYISTTSETRLEDPSTTLGPEFLVQENSSHIIYRLISASKISSILLPAQQGNLQEKHQSLTMSKILTKRRSPTTARTTPIAPVAMQQRRVCLDPQHPTENLNKNWKMYYFTNVP